MAKKLDGRASLIDLAVRVVIRDLVGRVAHEIAPDRLLGVSFAPPDNRAAFTVGTERWRVKTLTDTTVGNTIL